MEKTLEKYSEILGKAEEQGDLKQAMRYMARRDLFFLLVIMCGRKDVIHPWLFDRCKEVQNSPDNYIDLWAR